MKELEITGSGGSWDVHYPKYGWFLGWIYWWDSWGEYVFESQGEPMKVNWYKEIIEFIENIKIKNGKT